MAVESVFEELARDFGGAYHGDRPPVVTMLNIMRPYVNASYRWNPKGDRPAIYLGVVSSTELNAFATFEGGYDIIAIHKGSSEIVPAVFNSLLTVHEPYPDSSRVPENTPTYIWPQLPRDVMTIEDAILPPNGALRSGVATYCIECAYMFLILHELGHVLHGHKRLPDEGTQNRAVIDERHASRSSSITEQTFEMDADAFAVWYSIPSLPAIQGKLSRSSGLQLEYVQSLTWWMYSVFCLIKLFSPATTNEDNVTRLKHPPTRVRQMWIIQGLMTACDHGEISMHPQILLTLAFQIANQADQDMARIAPEDSGVGGLATAQVPAIDYHLMKLKNHWNALRPQLDTVCYVTNLPPLYSEDKDWDAELENIRVRAYFHFENRTGDNWRDPVSNWLQAENEYLWS